MYIDAADFSNRTQLGKFIFLAIYIDLFPAQIAKIVNKTKTEVQFILTYDTNLTNPETDMLLSVLAYVMRLSGYDTEMMSRMWNATGEFKNSTDPPPWDKVGLSSYLEATGSNGLSSTLEWIRKH